MNTMRVKFNTIMADKQATDETRLAALDKLVKECDGKFTTARKRLADIGIAQTAIDAALATSQDFAEVQAVAAEASKIGQDIRARLEEKRRQATAGQRARLDAAWSKAEEARKAFVQAVKAFDSLGVDWAEYLPEAQQARVLSYFGEGARIQTGETVSQAAGELDLNPRAVLAYLKDNPTAFPTPKDANLRGKGAHTIVYRLSRPGLAKAEDLSADLDASLSKLAETNKVK